MSQSASSTSYSADMWRVLPSKYALSTENPIRKIVDNIKKPEKADKDIIPLSLGDPTVFGNLKTPEVLVESVVKHVRSGAMNGYSHSAGTELARAAVAARFGTSTSPLTSGDIILTSGCSGALEIAISGLADAGDNILLPQPGFALYQVIAQSRGIECRFYNLLPEKQWEADVAQMESLIDERTKFVLINNPSNPCGSVFSRNHLLDILALAERRKLPILADEIYDTMTFNTSKFYPIASLTSTVPVIAVGGLAKQFLVPGWRLGWILIHDRNHILEEAKKGLFKLTQLVLGPCSLVQACLPDVLTPQPGSVEEAALQANYNKYLQVLEENAELTVDRLQRVPGLRVVVPQGTMYAMIELVIEDFTDITSDTDFAQKLLEEECVIVLPGQCFRMKNFFRVVYSAPKEKLADAYDRITAFCLKHTVKSDKLASGELSCTDEESD